MAQAEIASALSGLDEEQSAAVGAPVGATVVYAGAGAGKTRVLTRRIAWRTADGSIDPRRVAVLTFTRKAAGELRRRLDGPVGDAVFAGTFHAFGYRLWEHYREHRNLPRRAISSNPKRLMAEVCDTLRGRPDPESLLRIYETGAARRLDAAGATAASRYTFPVDLVAEALAGYERLKAKRGVMDLSDLLGLSARAISDDATFAESMRWLYRHLLVDEAQDMNRAQWQLLRAVLGDRDDVWLVGDPRQAIYGWNGAERSILDVDFGSAYPDAQRFELRTNYRSATTLVAIGDAASNAKTPTATPPYREPGTARVMAFDTEEAEAAAVGWAIRGLLAAGAGCSHIAVLARTKKRLEAVERDLRNRDIPVRTGRHLLDEPDVARALRLLEASNIDFPASNCLTELRQIVDDIVGEMLPPRDEDDEFDEPRSVDAATKRAIERLDQLLELVDEWRRYFPTSRLSLLRDWLASSLRSRGGDPGEPYHGVELATVHRAKGLEFPHVFVIGLEDNQFPLGNAVEADDEESRVFYVAVTRAQTTLTLSRAREVAGVQVGPSPYLADVEPIIRASDEVATDRDAIMALIGELKTRLSVGAE